MILGIKAKGANSFFIEMAQRLEKQKGFIMVYDGWLKQKGNIWILSLTPRLPEFYKLGLLMFAAAAYLMDTIGWLGWFVLIPGFLMMTTYIFWSKYPYMALMSHAIKKKYPKANIEYYFNDELIKKVV